MRRRRGFSLIEVLVVIAIIVVLMALLIPAVQRVREAAARTQCGNNLKQLGLALHMFVDVRKSFPPGQTTEYPRGSGIKVFHGWAIYLLPHLEQDNLARQYTWTANDTSTANQPVRVQSIPTLLCPTAGGPRFDSTADTGSTTFPFAVSDYAPISGVADHLCVNLGYTPTTFPTYLRRGIMATDAYNSVQAISDGLSNTVVIAEDANRPNRIRRGQLAATGTYTVSGAGWAARGAAFDIDGADPATGQSATNSAMPQSCVVNCSNENEIYAYHPQLANVLFADGSVHALRESISAEMLIALVTPGRGEPVDMSGF